MEKKGLSMKMLQAAALFVGGAICGSFLGASFGLRTGALFHTPVVHAQDQFTTFAGCISVVPKEWGNFVGASTYGLTFQDEKGTLRFLEHPTCGSAAASMNSIPTATIDLQVQRR
jgi:hypothetical protein